MRLAGGGLLPKAGEEATLQAVSLDGRRISGRVLVASPEDEPTLVLTGLGELTVDGRAL